MATAMCCLGDFNYPKFKASLADGTALKVRGIGLRRYWGLCKAFDVKPPKHIKRLNSK